MNRLRIAVAEDEWLLAEQLVTELEGLGHEVSGVARTGTELLATVSRERPDLVLVDIRLARGSDGLAAAKEVQAHFQVPVIAVTGHLTPEEAEAAGLLGLVSKPLTPARLRAVLAGAAAWLERGTSAGTRPFLTH